MQVHRYNFLELTTESTLPGSWMRSAFTTWNTSTMPSVLQHSVALIREQNTPHRLTVSLHTVQVYVCVCVCLCVCVCVCVYGRETEMHANTEIVISFRMYTFASSLYTCKMGEGPNPAGSPAMDNNGSVSSPPLYHQHLLNDVNDGTGGGAQTLWGPARHLELGHLVHLTRLQDQRQEVSK